MDVPQGGGGDGRARRPQGSPGNLPALRALRPLAADRQGGEEVCQLRQRGEGVSENDIQGDKSCHIKDFISLLASFENFWNDVPMLG